MSLAEQIEARLRAELTPENLVVLNESAAHHGHASSPRTGSSHFRVRITAERFRNLSLVEQHRLVYGILAEELRAGVHALALETRAPDDEKSPGK